MRQPNLSHLRWNQETIELHLHCQYVFHFKRHWRFYFLRLSLFTTEGHFSVILKVTDIKDVNIIRLCKEVPCDDRFHLFGESLFSVKDSVLPVATY